MSAWGLGIFQNDWTLDWLGELCDSEDGSLVRIALAQVVEHGCTKRRPASIIARLIGRRTATDWLTAEMAAQALAAAEVVAYWIGHPSVNFPEKRREWLQQHTFVFQPSLVPLAIKAVNIVKTDSELRDIFEEKGEIKWRDVVADLERRLGNEPEGPASIN